MKCIKMEELTANIAVANILDLNEDCLLDIFQRLPLVAQVRFASVCPRLRSVFQFYCQRHRKVLRKDDISDMNTREMKRFFEMAGPYFRELINLPYSESERNSYVNLVHKFCRNVQKVYIGHAKIQSHSLKKLLANMKELNSLHMVKCNLDDESLLAVAGLTNLESLKLEQENKITGRHLSELTNLQELSFIDCSIQDDYLMQICKSAKELKRMSLLGCPELTENSISCITAHCLQMEELKLFCTSSMECSTLAHLPKLTMLEVYKEHFNGASCKHFLETLAAHRAKQLQSLRIYSSDLHIKEYATILARFQQLKLLGFDCNKYINAASLKCISRLENLETLSLRYCESITNEAILTLLSGCLSIKYINLMYCDKLNVQLVYDAIKLLRKQLNGKQRCDSDAPVLMLVGGTRIRKSVIMDPIYSSAISILRLNFTRPSRNARLNMYHSYRIRVLGELKYFY